MRYLTAMLLPNPIPYFAKITDPRCETKNKIHALQDILMIVLCASICGFDDWVGIEDFAYENSDWFKEFIGLEHGIPSHDTISKVMGRLNKDEFAQSFSQWIQSCLPQLDQRHIAIDGKMIGGGFSSDKAIHLVTAFASQTKMVLAQYQVDSKQNEISALPHLLKLIDLKGSIVSADAIYCQKDICHQLIEQKADYVLSLKENHKNLFDDASLWLNDQDQRGLIETIFTVDKDHGRFETRRYGLSTNIDWLDVKNNWHGLKALGFVESRREMQGKVSIERRYYLTSLIDLKGFSKVVRAHWSIENQQHWVLDVQFREDESRGYKGNQRANMALIRRAALNLLRSNDDNKKVSIKRRIAKACMNLKYRRQILFG